MATGTLTPTRDQLKRWCTDDQGTDEDLLLKIEQIFFGVEDLPNLQDGIDNNTLSIDTLSDLVRPITIDLIQPLSGAVAGDTTYTLTVAQATEGMKTIFIPAAYLIASAAGPFTLTISTGAGTTVKVPIVTFGDAISSPDLLFDIHVDSSGNIAGKAWEVSGSNTNGNYCLSYSGEANEYKRLNGGTATETWTFPFPFIAAPTGVAVTPSTAAARMATNNNATSTSVDTDCWTTAGAGSNVVRFAEANGRWRA